jgi:hypothetical protein
MRPAKVSREVAERLMAEARARGQHPKPLPVLKPRKPIGRGKGLGRTTRRIRRSPAARARIAAWPALRASIIERDNGTCLVCGAKNAFGLTAHHVQFRSQLGPDDPWNLATVCQGPGLSGCHFSRCHGTESKSVRRLLWNKLAILYTDSYIRDLDGNASPAPSALVEAHARASGRGNQTTDNRVGKRLLGMEVQ